MNIDTWAIVLATFFGPIGAVQAQMFLERQRAKKYRREQIFYTLMRTRASSLSPEHVQALNAIPLEFRGVEVVTNAFKSYIDHISTPVPAPPADTAPWVALRIDLLIDIMAKMAAELGYKYTAVELKHDFYNPVLHSTIEAEQTAIRAGLAKVLSGQGGIPVEVKSFPGDPEAQAAFKAVLKAAAARMKSGEPPEGGPDRP
jgi:hypothetical protein